METTLPQFIVIETDTTGISFLHMRGDIDPLISALIGSFEQNSNFLALVLTALDAYSSNNNVSIENIMKQAKEL